MELKNEYRKYKWRIKRGRCKFYLTIGIISLSLAYFLGKLFIW